MKNIVKLTLFFLISISAQAQQTQKNDIILQTNGDELSGKVVEISDDAVKFTYAGETLTYSIKKSDIIKITFSSGRIQIFNKPQPAASSQNTTAAAEPSGSDHHNKIAVLPFAFVKEGQKAADEMSNVVQAAAYTYLTKHAGVLQVMDPRTTNAKLIKAGVTRENMEGYTMDDICNILGVEFIVDGTVMLNKVSAQTQGSSVYTDNTKKDANKTKSTGYSSASATSYENYATTINIDIYNDKGNNLFSQSRKSFFSTQDAYQSALEYVLKRSPVYSK